MSLPVSICLSDCLLLSPKFYSSVCAAPLDSESEKSGEQQGKKRDPLPPHPTPYIVRESLEASHESWETTTETVSLLRQTDSFHNV